MLQQLFKRKNSLPFLSFRAEHPRRELIREYPPLPRGYGITWSENVQLEIKFPRCKERIPYGFSCILQFLGLEKWSPEPCLSSFHLSFSNAHFEIISQNTFVLSTATLNVGTQTRPTFMDKSPWDSDVML